MCKVEGCNNKIHSRGYCSKHYIRLYRSGKLKKINENKMCSTDGCKKASKVKGYCLKHYELNRKYGTPKYKLSFSKCLIDGCNNETAKLLCQEHRRTDKYYELYKDLITIENMCIVNGCNCIREYKDYCYKHYHMVRRTGSPYGLAKKKCDISWCNEELSRNAKYCQKHDAYFRRHKKEPEVEHIYKHDKCSVDNCDNKSYVKGMCSTHYQRFIKYKTTDLPERVKVYTIDGCNNKPSAKGLCSKHYE